MKIIEKFEKNIIESNSLIHADCMEQKKTFKLSNDEFSARASSRDDSHFFKQPAVFCKNKHMMYHPIKTMLGKPYYDGQIRGIKNSTLRERHGIKDLGKRLYIDKHPTSIIEIKDGFKSLLSSSETV